MSDVHLIEKYKGNARKKEIEAIARGEIVDHNVTRFYAPKIY